MLTITEINTPEDLKTLARQMKAVAETMREEENGGDDPPENYTKTEEDVEKLKEDCKHQQVPKHARVIQLYNSIYSVCLTPDNTYNKEYHLSFVQVTRDGFVTPEPEAARIISENFFSKPQNVPNPGKMTDVIHYVGND